LKILFLFALLVLILVFPIYSANADTNGKIAFANRIDGDNEIYIMNADGTSQIKLTNNIAHDLTPSWSPDGTKIVFVSERESGGIYIMNADGTSQTKISNNFSFMSAPSWSPDGTKMAITTNDEIYIMNADGTSQTRLTNNNYLDTHPDWSPDGTKIAFTSKRDGNNEIYIMNADGTSQTRLTNNIDNDIFPDWSPDGTKIAIAGDTGQSYSDIYVINADGSARTNISHNSYSYSKSDWIRNVVPPTDTDKDGIPDSSDSCPTQAETLNGYQDTDGCPDVVPPPKDTDGDGIPDSSDSCPTQAETLNGYQDTDGCPDTNPASKDTDGDGISDSLDQCPTQKETVNGFADLDGCPDVVPQTDTDGDGISDSLDQCPTQKETVNGYQDTDGCPDVVTPKDTDNDGIDDKIDQCPTQAETVNGFQDTDGCPDVVTQPIITVNSPSDNPNSTIEGNNLELKIMVTGAVQNKISGKDNISVTFTDPKGTTVYQKSLTLNSQGNFNNEFDNPLYIKDMRDSGLYHAKFVYDTITKDFNWNYLSSVYKSPVYDIIPPVIVVPNNMAIQATSNNPSPVTFSVSATDDKDGSVTPICSPKSGSNFAIGTTTVSCTVTDNAGNTATKSFTVTVTEATAKDTDKDGISDSTDKCPTQAETINGFQDTDGCPDKSLTPDLIKTCGEGTYLVNGVCKIRPDQIKTSTITLTSAEPKIVDSNNKPVSIIKANDSVFVNVGVENLGKQTEKFVGAYRYIQASTGKWSEWTWVSASVNAGKYTNISIPWSPTMKDSYEFDIEIWDDEQKKTKISSEKLTVNVMPADVKKVDGIKKVDDKKALADKKAADAKKITDVKRAEKIKLIKERDAAKKAKK
jgi:Tol biopolymer transport system component